VRTVGADLDERVGRSSGSGSAAVRLWLPTPRQPNGREAADPSRALVHDETKAGVDGFAIEEISVAGLPSTGFGFCP
jgi:hypothetical protein